MAETMEMILDEQRVKNERIKRARHNDLLTRELGQARKSVEQLEIAAQPGPGEAALIEMSKHLDGIPARLATRGTSLFPGGQNLRDALAAQINNGLSEMARLRDRAKEKLPAARAALVKAEADFKREFTD